MISTRSIGRARSARRGAAVVATLLMAVVAGAAPATAGTETAQQVLKRAEKFVKKAKTVSFTAALGAGGATAGSLEEAAVFPDRGHVVLTFGGEVVEAILVKDLAFSRGAAEGTPLDDVVFEPEYGHPTEWPIFQRPQDIRNIFGELRDPEIVSQGPEGTVVRADFKEPGKVYNLGPNPYTAAHLEATIAADGEPTDVTLVASGPDGEVNAKAEDLAWNGRVTVPKVPKKAALIDEGAVSQFADASLYQPASIPRGWKLGLAHTLPAEATLEGCPQVVTAYEHPRSHQQVAAVIFQFPTSCAQPQQGSPDAPAEPLTLGDYQGTIVDDERPGLEAQFDVNGTTIQVGTSLTRAELEKVFGSLVPLDFDKPPKANLPAASTSSQ